MYIRSATRSVFPIAALAVLCACAAKVDGTGGSGASQRVAVEVTPGSASLATGQAAQFDAGVTGTADLGVTWQVDESTGGGVTQAGLYTAPGTAGTYHVRAVSHADSAASGVATITVTVPPVGSVTISPKTVNVVAGGTTTFTATVSNLSNSAVTWKVQETSGCGSVTTGGAYAAPPAAAICHVVATSVADSTKSDVATVTVTAPVVIKVAVTPSTVTMDACTSRTFTATVTGNTDQAVAWSVAEGSAGGSVNSGGVYTTPSAAGTYHVVATSHASSSVTASATVTVQDHVLSIAVSPASTTVNTGAGQQFTATVTTTCGTFAAK
jgi:hypothetical protein